MSVENTKSDKVTKEKSEDVISAHKLIEFLEYEEALTRDIETANRIRKLLSDLGLWN